MHQVGRRRFALSLFGNVSSPLGSHGLIIRRSITDSFGDDDCQRKRTAKNETYSIYSTNKDPDKEQKRGGNGYSNMNGCGSFENKTLHALVCTNSVSELVAGNPIDSEPQKLQIHIKFLT